MLPGDCRRPLLAGQFPWLVINSIDYGRQDAGYIDSTVYNGGDRDVAINRVKVVEFVAEMAAGKPS